uniref:ribonuclease H n=1 Tax=Astyanax mexicanus TaxID=7994 RepID=A0A8B9JE72_ASTMX
MAPGNIPPPSPMKLTGDVSSNWEIFRAEFEDYALATELLEKSEVVQAATLRTVMGAECRHIYKHNLALTDEQRADTRAILDALEEYFKPAKNVIYERYNFGICKQEEGEPIDSFVTRLREKAATCEYGELKDDLIRDKIVLGIADENTRRRLLRERQLTLNSAIDTCRMAELTNQRLKSMIQDAPPLDCVNAMRQQSTKQPSPTDTVPIQCRYCGSNHRAGREHCPAFGKQCKACGTSNHFARVCLKSKKKRTESKLHKIDDIQQDNTDIVSDDLYATEHIGSMRAKGKKWYVKLHIQGKLQQCQLDTGATCDVMSLNNKMSLAPKTPLLPSSTKLKLYSGQLMPSLGLFSTSCSINDKTHNLEFEIVKTDQPPLLSGSTCERLGLVQFTIPANLHALSSTTTCSNNSSILTKETLLARYRDVFYGPIESVPGEVHFDLDEAVRPMQCAPRNVPVAMKAAVKAQLDQHQADGHIAPVTDPTDWISNMVIVKKPDKLRLCIDPKHLNTALRRSHYIMPTLEDVLYKLPKAKVFTLVDARDAFLQCRLDEESSLMTTFWTPWGRMRWLKLPFGVSVAPEVYQRKQHELLAGLNGVEPIADDILVVGCGDSQLEANQDHDIKLLALMNRCREVNLKLSAKKLQFKVSAVRFHGHILSAEGLKADPEKIKAVIDMPTPSDAKAVQRFVGFVTYIARFLPGLSELCEPLRRLTDKGTVWHWLPKHDRVIQEIKHLVTSAPVLQYYDVSKPVTIQSDASQHGL